MKSYKTDSPVFSDKLDLCETTDPAHADLLNQIYIKLFENTLVLQKQNDDTKKACAKGEGIEFSIIDGILTATYDDGVTEETTEGSEE